MARPLRIEYEGAFYHIIQRGIERKHIFQNDKDKEKFLTYLKSANTRYQSIIHTFVLMDNHYHLILETPRGNLSKIMHYINTSYAVYYNTRHKRVGPLYQGRYKSVIVQADGYLHHLSRYIHLNPVRAKIVSLPEEYNWSSYGYFIKGKDSPPEYLDPEFILSMFNNNLKKAKGLYEEFVIKGIGKEMDIIGDNLIKGFVLGDNDFFEAIVNKYVDRDEDSEIPVIREIRKIREPSFERIQEAVENKVGDNKRMARRLILYLCRKYTQKTLNEIGEFCGDISDTGVSQAFKRVKETRKYDSSFDKLISAIERGMKVWSVET